jgi:hypothetical protein
VSLCGFCDVIPEGLAERLLPLAERLLPVYGQRITNARRLAIVDDGRGAESPYRLPHLGLPEFTVLSR